MSNPKQKSHTRGKGQIKAEKAIPGKIGLFSFKLETVRHDGSKVEAAFARQGWDKYCPDIPNDKSAFLAARASMDKIGSNPKIHGAKLPLLPGHKVSFLKVDSTKSEVVVNVNVQDTAIRGNDAPCRQVIVFDNRGITYHKPDGLADSDYLPSFMAAEFQAVFDDCRKIDSEDIRNALHRIFPILRPYWIIGRIVFWFDADQNETACKLRDLLVELGANPYVKLFEADKQDADCFVRAMGENVKAQLSKIDEAFTGGKEKRDTTWANFGKDIQTLEGTLLYYSDIVGVAQGAMADWMAELAHVKACVQARLEGKPLPEKPAKDKPVEADAADPFAE